MPSSQKWEFTATDELPSRRWQTNRTRPVRRGRENRVADQLPGQILPHLLSAVLPQPESQNLVALNSVTDLMRKGHIPFYVATALRKRDDVLLRDRERIGRTSVGHRQFTDKAKSLRMIKQKRLPTLSGSAFNSARLTSRNRHDFKTIPSRDQRAQQTTCG